MVPISEVVERGELDIFPEVRSKGYFDIDLRQGRLVLTAKNYIGLIPINSRVSIHVAPRAPIQNVLYLAQRANKAVSYVPRFTRGYAVTKLTSGHPEEVFAEPLVNYAVDVECNGLMRRYISRIVTGFRGRILFAPTIVQRLRSAGTFGQVREVTEFSTDIPENRAIKEVLRHAYHYFSTIKRKDAQALAKRSAALIGLFESVSDRSQTTPELFTALPQMIRRLPGNHVGYEPILWLCYLIATRQAVSLETFGPARIETMLINVADVFEGYVRTLIAENLHNFLPTAQWHDGNIRQVPLFRQGLDMTVKPDVYVTLNGKTLLVLDAKYKPSLKAADRYEVIAFCEALQSRCAIFVSPADRGTAPVRFLGRTPGGIDMHEIRIDLASDQMDVEENEFVGKLATIVHEHMQIKASAVTS